MERGPVGTLYVFKGNYGLPSVDPRCLQLIFLLRLHAKHNIAVSSCGFCTSPKLPYLKTVGKSYRATRAILDIIDKMVTEDFDKNYSTVDKSRILAYKTLTNKVFSEVVDLHFWGYDKNNQYLIKLYGDGKYFPFRIIFARRMNSYAQQLVFDLTEKNSLAEILKHGNDSLDTFLAELSNMLKGNKYLLGNKPSSLDAYVCGYLAPVIILDFPNKILQNIVNNHKNVVKYVKMFLEEFGDKYQGAAPSDSTNKATDSEKAPLGLIIFAGFIAVSTMLCFGLLNDIIKVK